MGSVKLDSALFSKRLGILQSKWKKSPEYSAIDVMFVTVGIPDETTVYQKSVAMHFWLFGYEFPETILVFRHETLYIITSHKKGDILEDLKGSSSCEIYICRLNPDISNMKECLDIVFSNTSGKAVGHLVKDKSGGNVCGDWKSHLDLKVSGEGYSIVDIGGFISCLLCIKDETERQLLKTAGKCSSLSMKELVNQIVIAVDGREAITHEKLAETLEEMVLESSIRFPEDVNRSYIDLCYIPIIQSGKYYLLKVSAVSNSDKLDLGIIVCSFGIRYKSYCTNIARTFLIEPDSLKETNYSFLLSLQQAIIEMLAPGTRLCDIYNKGLEYVREKRPDLVDCLLSNFGWSIGIEFRESDYVINAKNTSVLSEGMALNLMVGLHDIKTDKDKYSMLISDTFVIEEGGSVLLTDFSKSLESASFFLKEEEDNEKSKFRKSTISKSAIIKNQNREKHQKELLQEIVRTSLAKYSKAADDSGQDKIVNKEDELQNSVECYKNHSYLPKDIGYCVYVDRRNECVLVPISGQLIPFHVSIIKNISKSDEGDSSYLRLNFSIHNVGTNTFQIKTMTFKSFDIQRFHFIYKEILDLKKSIATKEMEKRELSDVVEQGNLEVRTGVKIYKLPDVYMRPVPPGKRLPGDLEIHNNGVRYKNSFKTENIDILFSNMKNVFFQPCDSEVIALMHFHLYHPVLIGKKKTKDIQIYREALDSLVDETTNRKNRWSTADDDEIMLEQEEKKQKSLLNTELKSFCEKLSIFVDVDMPIRHLGFYGVPLRQNVLVQPTRDCLVYLTDPPFFIISLNDVEIASFERVLFGLRNFDLVFIFKDHNKPPQHIDSIPMKSIETVKEILDSSNVYFIQSNVNFNWGNLLKTVRDDPVGFYELGGWDMIRADSENRGSSEEETEESAYEESSGYEDDDYSDYDTEEEEEEEDEEEQYEDEYDGEYDSEDLEDESEEEVEKPKKRRM